MKDKQQKYLLEHYNNPDTYYAAAFGFAAFFILSCFFKYYYYKIYAIRGTPGCRSPCNFFRKPNEKKRQWGEIKHAEIRKHKNGIYKPGLFTA